MKTRILDGAANGTYTDDFNDAIAKDWIFTDVIPSDDLFKPLWDEDLQEWYEGEDQDVIDDLETKRLTDILSAVCFKTRLWAKAIVMGKTVEDDLDYFQDVYTEKYNQCQDLNDSFDYFLDLEATAEGYGSLEDYKMLVITKFETGLAFFKQAKAMTEVFRKVVLFNIENKDFGTAESQIILVDNLPRDITPSDFAVNFQNVISL